MADKHEVEFLWPHPEPNSVIVTGTFDNWAKKIHLTKGTTGFYGSTWIAWNERIAYKFIVDGEWMLLPGEPTEADGAGNINNIYTAPPLSADVISKVAKPTTDESAGSTQELLQPESTMNSTTSDINLFSKSDSGIITPQVETTAAIAQVVSVSEQKGAAMATPPSSAPEPSEHAVTPKPEPSAFPVVDDNEPELSNHNGTPAGTDEPVKPQDDAHDISENHTTPPSPPVAPDVPISIVPVNAEENNTAPPAIPSPDAHHSIDETQAPTAEPTQPPVATVDSVTPPPDEPIPSTHSVITSGSTAPVVGIMDSKDAEPSPPPTVSHTDDTAAHPEPEAPPSPPNATSETPNVAETTTMDPHAPATTDKPSDGVEKPQEVTAHAQDNEPAASASEIPAPVGHSAPSPSTVEPPTTEDTPATAAKEEPATAPPPATEATSPESADKLSAVPVLASEASEQGGNPTATPSHTNTDESTRETPAPATTETSPDAGVSSAYTRGAEHAHNDVVEHFIPPQVNQDPTPQQEESIPAAAEPTGNSNGSAKEVTPTPPKPTETETESSAAAGAATATPTEPPTQPAPEPAAEKVNGSAPPTEAETPKPDIHVSTAPNPPTPEQAAPAPGALASPSTPTKNGQPSPTSPTASPSSSKFNPDGTRKKRTSFFGKVKHLFTHDKEREKEKEKKEKKK